MTIFPCRRCGEVPEVENRGTSSNADRFRAKTDEELAKWFGTHACCMKDPFFCGKTGGSCKACWLDWLKEEAKDGEEAL